MRIRSRIVLALVVAAFACTRIQTAYAFGPENDGTTTMLPVGSEIRLVLPADFEWNIEATDPKFDLERTRRFLETLNPREVSTVAD